ncbi:MAG: carboxypeptidase-like regulatory domain-containing protein [Planctomycetota bacterium]
MLRDEEPSKDAGDFDVNASHSGDGEMTVRDFVFQRGSEQIRGRVVDGLGNPVAGARAQIMSASPSLWIGHHKESQNVTDANGEFALRRIPPGRYRLYISGKRNGAGSRPPSVYTMVDAGTTDLELTLEGIDDREPRRLVPKKIEQIK